MSSESTHARMYRPCPICEEPIHIGTIGQHLYFIHRTVLLKALESVTEDPPDYIP